MKSRPNLKRFREDLDHAIKDTFEKVAALNYYAERRNNDPYLRISIDNEYYHASAYENGLTQALYWLKGEKVCEEIYEPLYEKHKAAFENGDYDPKENE